MPVVKIRILRLSDLKVVFQSNPAAKAEGEAIHAIQISMLYLHIKRQTYGTIIVNEATHRLIVILDGMME